MAYLYGQHMYSQYRYSWLDEWQAAICEPNAWSLVTCGPAPPNTMPVDPTVPVVNPLTTRARPHGRTHAGARLVKARNQWARD